MEEIGFSPSIIEARTKEHATIRSGNVIRTIKAGVSWRLQLADRSAIPLLQWMYYPGHPMAMPRKAALASRAASVFSNKQMLAL
ncbi:MAG: hypothetical protein AB1631_28735 [Acidobacteriota bacterium]